MIKPPRDKDLEILAREELLGHYRTETERMVLDIRWLRDLLRDSNFRENYWKQEAEKYKLALRESEINLPYMGFKFDF